jgi:hypothetical protein
LGKLSRWFFLSDAARKHDPRRKIAADSLHDHKREHRDYRGAPAEAGSRESKIFHSDDKNERALSRAILWANKIAAVARIILFINVDFSCRSQATATNSRGYNDI